MLVPQRCIQTPPAPILEPIRFLRDFERDPAWPWVIAAAIADGAIIKTFTQSASRVLNASAWMSAMMAMNGYSRLSVVLGDANKTLSRAPRLDDFHAVRNIAVLVPDVRMLVDQKPTPYCIYGAQDGYIGVWRLLTGIDAEMADTLTRQAAQRLGGRPIMRFLQLPTDRRQMYRMRPGAGGLMTIPRSLWDGVQTGGDISLSAPPRVAHPEPSTALIEGTVRHVEDPRSRQLEAVLLGLGFRGSVVSARPGPTITLFAFQPAAGSQESKIIARENDIAREMSAFSVRVAALPGTTTIGVEIPNSHRETVRLTDLTDGAAFRASPAKLALALGKTIGGEPVITDLARMPHLLLAGTTGSGKSVGLNVMILSLLYRMSPEQLRFIMIDPKELELAAYDGIPHLLRPIATDPGPAIAALEWAITEMGARYKRMRGKCMGISDYQRDFPDDPMPYLVIVVDEVADLMAMADKKTVEGLIQRLAQKGRAAGIHLIIATQRPSVDVITGDIKANFPSRIAFQVITGVDSKVILDTTGAEQLLGMGDALFMDCGRSPNRVHVSYTSMADIQRAVSDVKAKWGEAQFEDVEIVGEGAPVFDGTGMGERETVGADATKIQTAMRFLYRRLDGDANGVASTALVAEAANETPPIAQRTLYRAAERIGVEVIGGGKCTDAGIWRMR